MEIRRPHQLRAHDDGVDRWSVIQAAPAARLRGLVSSYADYREPAVRASLAEFREYYRRHLPS